MMYFSLTLNTVIQFDGTPDRPVSNAIAILRRDMEKTLDITQAPANMIHITQPCPEMPDESWVIEITKKEILIKYNGSLGCVYALLFISRKFLGIPPFWFWNDQTFQKRPGKNIPEGIWHSPEYAVRFRGWFVNDEVLIDNWDDNQSEEHWRLVFEAILRCGGNMTIPGTDCNSKKNASLAASMGLWITHHHAEPLGAEMFLRIFPDEIPSYFTNSHLFEQLWEKAVIEQKNYQVIWGLGFRGQGDRPFWDDDPQYKEAKQRGKLISDIIKKQLEIIKRHVPSPVYCVNIYGEIAELYRGGFLDIPQGVIKIWADNGYGRMVSRRQGNSNPRIYALPAGDDSGPHGIYYHCSFHDLQASNHLTMSPNSADFLTDELGKALSANAKEYWIVNSGSVKPHVHPLDLLQKMWRHGQIDVNKWRVSYVYTYYGYEAAEELAALFYEYANCTAKYGSQDDERAGEQLWHHPVRELLCQWMSGDTKTCLESLFWLTGNKPFAEQVKFLKNICDETLHKWESFIERCRKLLPLLNADSQKLFCDSIFLHGRLHYHGAAGAKFFCESFLTFITGDVCMAFRLADESHSHFLQSVTILTEAEHDKWAGYYKGDCLTDVRLTAINLNALVSYLRVLGDGPSFNKWEKDFLTEASERNVALLSSKQRAMTNEELAKDLAAAFSSKNAP